MAEYSELVKKLRDLHRDPRPASAEWLFENQVALYDAAAAIEDLQAENKKTVTQIFGEEQMAWEERCVGLMRQISEQKAYDIRQLPEGLYGLKNGVVYTARMKLPGGNVYNVKTGESHWEDDRIVGGEQVLPKPEPPKEGTHENRDHP